MKNSLFIAFSILAAAIHVFPISFSPRGISSGDETSRVEIERPTAARAAQVSIIGKIKRKPDEGYICYAVLLKDWNAPPETRPYIFYITDQGGRMNISGADVELKLKSDAEKKGKNGKTYVDWIYENKTARAHFALVVSEIPDSSAVVYDGKATVATGGKTQTVRIKAFCGG